MFSSTLRSALFAVAVSALSVSAAPGLTVQVSAPSTVVGVDNLRVVTTVTNSGTETLKLVNDPNGPLTPFAANTFAITDANGQAPKFTGYKLKFSPKYSASINDVTVLTPGQSVEVTHELEHTYNFSASGAGAYNIQAHDIPFFVVGENNEITTLNAEVKGASTHVSGKLISPRMRSPLAKRASYVGCSSSQQSQLVTAAANAQSYAASASSYAASHTSSTTRFVTWFGTYTTAHHTTIASHFSKLNSNTYSSYTYDCTCTDSGTYAFVDPSNFGYVTLCGAFWSAPQTGTDSKGGTLIHESSHFTANGGTDDYAYGQSAAKSLAISNSAEAVFNADSHEYFAENNPAQS